MAPKPYARKRNPASAIIRPASEDSLVRLFERRYPVQHSQLKKGIGDDAAIIRPKGAAEYWLITSDMLVEEVDFRFSWTTPRQLGRKAIAVNLSDLAAMGARPRFFTVSLAIPPAVSERWILEFHDGLAAKGRAYGAELIGGDLSRTAEHIVISVTAVGESLNRKVVERAGGKAGDLLYVTGTLGRSAAGLKMLSSPGAKGRPGFRKEVLKAQLDPDPRCDAGLWLAQSGLASCMMDVSDGLSMDLPRLCAASGVGAEIRIQSLPVFPQSAFWNCDPVELALHGGEDFELLFAVPRLKNRRLESTYPSNFPPITRIGEMTSEAGKIWIAGQTPDEERELLPGRGWDHFRSGRYEEDMRGHARSRKSRVLTLPRARIRLL